MLQTLKDCAEGRQDPVMEYADIDFLKLVYLTECKDYLQTESKKKFLGIAFFCIMLNIIWIRYLSKAKILLKFQKILGKPLMITALTLDLLILGFLFFFRMFFLDPSAPSLLFYKTVFLLCVALSFIFLIVIHVVT